MQMHDVARARIHFISNGMETRDYRAPCKGMSQSSIEIEMESTIVAI